MCTVLRVTKIGAFQQEPKKATQTVDDQKGNPHVHAEYFENGHPLGNFQGLRRDNAQFIEEIRCHVFDVRRSVVAHEAPVERCIRFAVEYGADCTCGSGADGFR